MSYVPNLRTGRIRSRPHMAFVGSLTCTICQRPEPQVHHLTCSPEPKARGLKASDCWTVPLCLTHHEELHAAGNERAWWAAHRIDALWLAADLWERSLATGRVKVAA